MRHLYKGCAGVVLMLVLSVSTFAGQIPCGRTASPPEPRSATNTTTTGETESEIINVVMTLLQGVLVVL